MPGPECCEKPQTLSSKHGGSVLQLGGFKTYVCGPSNSKLAILVVSDVFGPGCCENPPTLSTSSEHGGSVLQLGGFKTYVCGTSNSKLAILVVSDVLGYEATNLRKLADKVAAAGYYVVVPDFLYGDPYNPENTEKRLSIWIQSHGTDKGFEETKQVVAALKDKGISAIGAAGFCWGAKVVTDLAKSDYVQAAVLLHPSLVTVDDFKAKLFFSSPTAQVKAPIAILAAEIDKISPPEILSSKPEVDSFVKIFPGVKHGWTVRYNVEDKEAVLRAEEAPTRTCWIGLPSMSSECEDTWQLHFPVKKSKNCHRNKYVAKY